MSTPKRVDPHDTESYNAWYDVYRPALDDGRPFAVTWTREEMRVGLVRPSAYWAKEIWAVRDDAGQIAGTLFLELPLTDNTSQLTTTIAVRQDARRQGYGRALARLLDERAAHHARTTLVTQLDIPLPTPAISEENPPSAGFTGGYSGGEPSTWRDGAGDGVRAGSGGRTAGEGFAAALGFSPANHEVHRVLELPLEDAFLEKLCAEAAERHQGYQLRSWQDRCPDELVDAYAALQATFALEAPQGELEVEAERWDAARVRSVEEQSRAQGRHGWITVAVAPDGTLAGNTELYVGEHDPGKAFQWGTLVSPPHRGHRLGLALKARNHLELQRVHREPLVVHTWNGEQNTAMNAVNARLGFHPVERHEEWQRRG
ncbi:hypothetical protein Kfla_6075 [Kribbella flavida DSM 17836]|uniref:N-acetyltransferase domain-containing protein n=1 Tax=Kribbella flavida (strain DSM 17836 / JCM 10339 / NBRC 14399) TaxID=479435 RepID=D2PT26_KRIFD|nr:GNAT family N-acetyltransferase [Kribbella flavida]ADB35078.1 hypothetical protein Kfla_6075 [Kribbella flavida DSM 17836]